MNYHNSTIKRKTCICEECKANPDKAKFQTLSCYSYFYAHLPPHLAKKAGTRKRVYQKNKNVRNAIMLKAKKEQRLINGESEQELWYLLRKHEMTGHCSEEGCSNSTNKYNNEYYRWSICHVVPKKLVPSVATHPGNWVELCWIHHQEFDATFERASKMGCFPEAKRKFELFKYLIPVEQMRKVNPFLLQTNPADPT